MKYKIIVDSSSDLYNNYLEQQGVTDIGFEVVPLTIHINGAEVVDNDDVDIDDMLNKMHSYSGKSTSSCPAPGIYNDSYTADYNFVISITSKLSGSFNSAKVAASLIEDEKKVFLIDSKGTAGSLEIIVIKLVELIQQNLSYEEICKEIIKFRDSLTLYFVLDLFDNLVKNGRMSKVAAVVAKIVHIKPLCKAEDGEIKIYQKIRTRKSAINSLINCIISSSIDFSSRTLVISHQGDEATALQIEEEVKKAVKFKNIIIRKMKGLCSFYALERGIICTY